MADGELDTVDAHVAAFYRLVGTDTTDDALVEHGEAVDDVVFLYLTMGCRAAQRTMIDFGYKGWRTRSTALTFTGTDAANGGVHADLPANFLRAFGDQRMSALRQADGTPWGQEVTTNDETARGDGYYFRGDELWLLRGAAPPSPLYLEYHFTHPAWNDALLDAAIDFPVDARSLIVAEAANEAKEESWLPGGRDMELKIERALARAKERARGLCRPSKQVRTMRKPVRHGDRW